MIEKMLEYRDNGLTEPKIADCLSVIFMRPFTADSVNRKIRDLKKTGYVEKNKHSGRYRNSTGEMRKGSKNEKVANKSKSLR